jgi:hypothetical protein
VDGVDFAGRVAGWQQPTDDKDGLGTPIFDELLGHYVARLEALDGAGPEPDEPAESESSESKSMESKSMESKAMKSKSIES